MRLLTVDELYTHFEEWRNFVGAEKRIPKEVLEICREKVNTLKQLYEFALPFVDEEYEYSQDYIEKFAKKPEAVSIIELALERFSSLENYDIQNVETTLREIAASLNIGTNKVFQTIRGALLGRLVTPGLFESIVVLGKEENN